MKNQNPNQDQNSDQDQNILENEELNQGNQDIVKDKMAEDTDENISNRSQKVTSREEESIITTERNPNAMTNFINNICGRSEESTSKEKDIKKYLDSEELKSTLKNVGFNTDIIQKVIEKLKGYLEKYESDIISLDELKNKVNNYFTKLKSANKTEIKKGNIKGENINEIQKQFSSCIEEECKISNMMETLETQTFGGDSNSLRDNIVKNSLNMDTLRLDILAINSNEGEIEKMAENKTTTALSEQSDGIDKYKIKLFIEIYENTFVYKISPATENLIIDLVLETEKYIEGVMESVKEYQIEEYIKKKILEAIAKSTSKESVEKNISELEDTGDFKMESSQKQNEDAEIYSKMLGKAKTVYNKIYNKYYGYSDLAKKQIDKIAEYAYKRYMETKEVSSKREEFNKNTMSKLVNNSNLEEIKDIEEFVASRGYTVENCDGMDFYEINQGLTMQSQDDDDVVADIPSNYCDLNCYTIAAASALVYAMSYMLAFDNEVSHHGFGPSGF